MTTLATTPCSNCTGAPKRVAWRTRAASSTSWLLAGASEVAKQALQRVAWLYRIEEELAETQRDAHQQSLPEKTEIGILQPRCDRAGSRSAGAGHWQWPPVSSKPICGSCRTASKADAGVERVREQAVARADDGASESCEPPATAAQWPRRFGSTDSCPPARPSRERSSRCALQPARPTVRRDSDPSHINRAPMSIGLGPHSCEYFPAAVT
jgi:hypothetical protein